MINQAIIKIDMNAVPRIYSIKIAIKITHLRSTLTAQCFQSIMRGIINRIKKIV